MAPVESGPSTCAGKVSWPDQVAVHPRRIAVGAVNDRDIPKKQRSVFREKSRLTETVKIQRSASFTTGIWTPSSWLSEVNTGGLPSALSQLLLRYLQLHDRAEISAALLLCRSQEMDQRGCTDGLQPWQAQPPRLVDSWSPIGMTIRRQHNDAGSYSYGMPQTQNPPFGGLGVYCRISLGEIKPAIDLTPNQAVSDPILWLNDTLVKFGSISCISCRLILPSRLLCPCQASAPSRPPAATSPAARTKIGDDTIHHRGTNSFAAGDVVPNFSIAVVLTDRYLRNLRCRGVWIGIGNSMLIAGALIPVQQEALARDRPSRALSAQANRGPSGGALRA